MVLIDAAGKACPIPVIEAKKALSAPETQEISIKVDNIIAVQNLEKMAAGLTYSFSYEEGGDSLYNVKIKKDINSKEPEIPPKSVPGKKLVILIGSDALGNGEPELGKALMKSFIYSLTELDTAPMTAIFINRGAYLTAVGSNAAADIRILENKGTEVLTCGTCLNYYGLVDSLAAGSIADMFGIVERMAAADSIISL